MNTFDIRKKAREALAGKWLFAALIVLIYTIIFASVNNYATGMWRVPLFLINIPLAFGVLYVFLMVARGGEPRIEDLFQGFRNYMNVIVTGVLVGIYTLLWSLLFLIPGIVAAISYSMTYFILMDEPDIDFQEAIRQSKDMMKGNKMRYFILMLSFIGWFFVILLTAGLATFWVIPYIGTAQAIFYEDLKGNLFNDGEVIDVQEPEDLYI